MSQLTEKQERFCVAYIEKGNASEAYRLAYDAGNMKPETVTKRASELIANANVAQRVSELRAPVVTRSQLTLEQHLEDLRKLRDSAEKDGQLGVAVQAEIARGKASGHYVKNIEIKHIDGLAERLARARLAISLETP